MCLKNINLIKGSFFLALCILSLLMCRQCLSCTCQPQSQNQSIQQLVNGGHSAYTALTSPPVKDQDFSYKIVPADDTEYYRVVVVQPYKYHGVATSYIPILNSSSTTNNPLTTGTVNQQFVNDMITHENWHVQIYQSYLNVYTALENWSATYKSGEFRSEDDARKAVEKDKKSAMDLVRRYDRKMQFYQNKHPNPGAQSNGRTWSAITPNWGARWLAVVQKFAPKFKTTPGSPMQ